jgi:PIN domain nuclease of toxin-antitoxin system
LTLLLDTHAVLWWRINSPRVKRAVREAIATSELVWVSAASGWEVAIKQALGKLELHQSFSSLVAASEFVELPITLAHAEEIATLPPHHTDPFDRMLIAQARVERATIVTHDRQFGLYDVPTIWI